MDSRLSPWGSAPAGVAHRFLLAIACTALAAPLASARTTESDVCVYGATAGGITAAVQARRMGKSVTLLATARHVGGLTTGGLGETDIGQHGDAYIQGMAREFYTRIGTAYGGGVKFRFEPKVASTVFERMLDEVGIEVLRDQRLAATRRDGLRIRAITMDNGDVHRARMFIDASYEGDLMAQAGVSHTSGREANSQYGETINGIQTRTSGNQVPKGIDPYVVPGDPSSGLLPGVNPDAGGPDGAADPLIQAYCFRMCLTDVPSNRVMIAKPDGYDERDYEILFRAIAAGQRGRFWKLSPMPNGKTDSNNDSGVSCDWISGRTADYLGADHAGREKIARDHERWQRGLVWTVQNHPRVPKAIRDAWGRWGLPKDEFVDNGHWPPQLYVREARRMVSDGVMTERHCMGKEVVPDPVTLAAYTMDSHNCQRIVRDGMVWNEGDIQRRVPAPYPVSYRALVPKSGECENLLVPWCLSATHIAFGSIRMEPVFMNLGQVAATAAALALDAGVPVQQLPYTDLRTRLLADGQRLSMGESPHGRSKAEINR